MPESALVEVGPGTAGTLKRMAMQSLLRKSDRSSQSDARNAPAGMEQTLLSAQGEVASSFVVIFSLGGWDMLTRIQMNVHSIMLDCLVT
jgi:hypothetical protein